MKQYNIKQLSYPTSDNSYPLLVARALHSGSGSAVQNWRTMLNKKSQNKPKLSKSDKLFNDVYDIIVESLHNNNIDERDYSFKIISNFNKFKLALSNVDNIQLINTTIHSDEYKSSAMVLSVAEYNKIPTIINMSPGVDSDHSAIMQCTAYSVLLESICGIHIPNAMIMTISNTMLPSITVVDTTKYEQEIIKRIYNRLT